MSVKWTPQQQQAIYDHGHDILVSAGAGSGKTAVLTERVLQHVLSGKNIDEMLILTFTRAAADQMKEKIRKKLREYNGPELSAQQKAVQLNKIDSSYIMTFDAFALSVVKKYHYLLNVSKDISEVEENIISLKTKQLLDEVMNEKYAGHDQRFEKLVGDFCVRDDQQIREWVIYLNKALAKRLDRQDFLKRILDEESWKANRDCYFREYEELLRRRISEVDEMLNQLSTMELDNFDDILDALRPLLDAQDYQQIHDSHPAVPTVKGSPEARQLRNEVIKKAVDKIAELTALEKPELLRQYDHTRDYVAELADLSQRLKEKMDSFKRRIDLYEFSDIFEMAVKIVDEHEEIRREISEHFFEIMIDEYQDTNDLQEYFISRISHDNVYMVGDIKQSIYRFRDARPDIFQGRYEDFRSEKRKGEVIDLLNNFRSRESVVNDINLIFNRLMDSRIGGADYQKEHQMVFGQKAYPADGTAYEMEILNYEHDPKAPPFAGQPKFSRSEVEAFIIGQDIQKRINNGMLVYDPDEKISRKACYSDFCILIDVSTQFELYKKILTYLQIPVRIEQDEELKGSDVLTVIKNIFRLIQACHQENEQEMKYYFTSLSRSFLIENQDSEIYRLLGDGSYLNTDLMKSINTIRENLDCKSIGALLEEMISEFDIDNRICRIGETYENQVRLEYLQQLCHQLNKLDYDYVSFIEYLDHIFDDERKITFKMNRPDVDAVRIQTIHKSKGLEYHICYFPGLDKGFNNKDRDAALSCDEKYGIIIQDYIENRGMNPTFVRELYREKYNRENISEKIRLLYVALTRTKEKIIMVGPFTDESDHGPIISDYQRLSFDRMIEMLNCQYDILRPYMKDIDLNDGSLTLSKDYNVRKDSLLKSLKADKDPLTVISHDSYLPQVITSQRFSKDSGLITPQQKHSLQFGSQMHYYLEIIDLANPDYELIEPKYRKTIRNFLGSELMKNVRDGRVYKEYEFVFPQQGQIRHGFIDLLVEYDDHFDIIDYKLKHIDDENYTMQLSGYRQYLQAITDKPVRCYLYSLSDGIFREVE